MSDSRHLRSMRLWRIMAVPVGVCLLAELALVTPSPAGSSVVTTAASSHTLESSANCAKGTAHGISASAVQVAVTVVDITGGSLTNATVGIPTVAEQEQYWNLVAKSVNKSGGAACRKIQLSFTNVNPVDTADAEQSCLTIADSHPYIVLDSGALTEIGASDCIPEAKETLISQFLTPDQLSKYYPFDIQPNDVPTDGLRNGVLGLKQLGYFNASKGFKKLGVLYDTCNPSLIVAERSALKQAQVPSSKIVEFNLGCPAGQAFTAASMEQAVVSFRSDGVTDVTNAGAGEATASFTEEAALQHYAPVYALTDDQVSLPSASAVEAGNPANLKGAVNVTGSGYGEAQTPGFQPSAGTKKCDAIYAAAGLPNVYKQLDGYGGAVCIDLWLVQAMLNHATSVQSAKLPAAMHAIGSVLYPYPGGPIDYTAAPKGSPYGVGYWRPEYYLESCKCWQIPNSTWHPPFK
jgi:hypothetical protein